MKVAIIGAGYVGATAAYTLLVKGTASEIALIDINKERAEGEALDLEHGLQFTPSTKVRFGSSYYLCKGASVIVITAGAHQKPGETRLDLSKKNAGIFKEMIPSIVKHNKDAIILVVANPLDVLTYLTWKVSKLSKNRVFGTGTILDTARFRNNLSDHFKVNPRSIHAYVLGEHGDSEFPVWSTANIAGMKLSRFPEYDKSKLDKVFIKTKNAAYEIISKKGATYYAIALGIDKIVSAILSDKNQVLPVSCLIDEYYGVTDVCLSIPVVLNKKGIRERIYLPLNKTEQKSLKKSASIIQEHIKAIENIK